MDIITNMFEKLLQVLTVQTFDKKAPDIQALHSKSIEEMMEFYEAEIYGDIYSPAWQRKLRQLSRRKKEEVIESEQRKIAAAAKVTAMDDKTPLQPAKK